MAAGELNNGVLEKAAGGPGAIPFLKLPSPKPGEGIFTGILPGSQGTGDWYLQLERQRPEAAHSRTGKPLQQASGGGPADTQSSQEEEGTT